MGLITRIEAARSGAMLDAFCRVAETEYHQPEFIRDEVAAGRIVIPANRSRDGIQAIGVGRALRTKININLGSSSLIDSHEGELAKLRCALNAGTDTVMDLSTGAGADDIRARILEASPVPVGTVPIYQAVGMVDDIPALSASLLLEVIEHQARQGVDFMTIHAGLLHAQLPAAKQRLLGIVSRGGSILAQWMTAHQRENPFYEDFDKVLDICRRHDVTLSLGDGMRPGCLADASDAAQFAELDVLGDLVLRCRAAGVQAMVEGPGHIPLHQIEMNMKKAEAACHGAPFYILGPVVADCAPGYDHIGSAIGAAMGAYHGAALLCCVTRTEHIGLPGCADIHEGAMAFRLAAHAADVALGRAHARDRDDAVSAARRDFDWEKQFELSLDPELARRMRSEALKKSAPAPESDDKYCTMCGPKYCAMRISRDTFHSEIGHE